MSEVAEVGKATPLQAQIQNRSTDKGVRAFLYDIAGTLITTKDLVHIANGLYLTTYTHFVAEKFITQYVAYTDGTFTTIDPDIETSTEVTLVKQPEGAYTNYMSTTCVTGENKQQLIAWATRGGERQTASTDCTVAVFDSSGTLVWTQSKVSPDANGVYLFENAVTLTTDANYYVVISIDVDGSTRTSTQSFFTVG